MPVGGLPPRGAGRQGTKGLLYALARSWRIATDKLLIAVRDSGHQRALSMSTNKVIAILLIIGGGLALAYGGFNYPKETHRADIGDLHIAVHEEQHVNIPVWAGIGALVGGILLLVSSKKS